MALIFRLKQIPKTRHQHFHFHRQKILQSFTFKCIVSEPEGVLNSYNFLLEKRPNARTAQKELEKLAPWNEEVQKMFARKMK